MNKRICVILSDSSNQLKDVNYNRGPRAGQYTDPNLCSNKTNKVVNVLYCKNALFLQSIPDV